MKKNKFRQLNDDEIQSYIKKNKLEAIQTPSGLYYLIVNQGDGKNPTPDSNVSIAYIGYLTNGNIFDKSEELEINLSVVIEGWKEGLSFFKEGGEGILLIPSHLAYGSTDYGAIPGGSVLIFDIFLNKVF
ncbi:FKBP-type peptidyl-prolyl cis-trans isomerase [Marinifilum caeruleilacunae]|uniref:Peptidyl-prolyl cis-trans isomerase n=1 Tax=Marinifilum caeruleilacunae TaxID=2499076 RepID=A0ABX1WQY9_9BACT|nr:FKBP-type peptidyl-prolyl cis-trans isomerase [Marinifilum caeruleilacunae]NOU58461.1 peptidylprolyl isomerase [Marinifilum caeruleilacunae]